MEAPADNEEEEEEEVDEEVDNKEGIAELVTEEGAEVEECDNAEGEREDI